MSCAQKIFKLWPHVGTCIGSTIMLPYATLANGTYKVVLNYLGTHKVFAVVASSGTLTLPTSNLNENFYYEGYVMNGAGVVQTFNTDYQRFGFYTSIFTNVE